MTNNEEIYDAEIAPQLLAIATRCKELGIALVAKAEFDTGLFGTTYAIDNSASLQMAMMYLCAMSGNNIDGYIISLMNHCRKNGIDTSGSIVMNKMRGIQ